MLSPTPQSCEPAISPETFQAIGRVLKANTGFCLEGYKDKCVKRRIQIRIRATQSPSPEAYSTFLGDNAAEQAHLLRVLTIHVSHFFRNPSTFEKLATEILPDLLGERTGGPVRLMSVGCARGEEPYSLALILREHFPRALEEGRVTIAGCDVDAATLEGARSAVYHRDRLAEVKPEWLSRWFTPEGERFRLREEVRSLVELSPVDLNDRTAWPACDLILCRNVLIYFERGRQEQILSGFANALGSGGVLVLGKSETLFGEARKRFKTVCPVERIYRAI